MASVGFTTDRPTGGDGHLCCAYAGEDEWARSTVGFVQDALAAGRQVLYLPDTAAPEAVLERLCRAGVDARAAADAGRLVVRRADRSHPRDLPFDPDRMVELWERACAAALAAGHAGLSAVDEMSWCARGTPGAERVLEYELRLDFEVFARLPLTVLCLYDRAVVPEDTTALLIGAHVRRPAPDGRALDAVPAADAEPPLAVTPLGDRVGLCLRGGADADTRAVLEGALAALVRLPGPVLHLDLSGADFLDTAAVAALAATARSARGRGRRLVVHHSPHSLRRVAEMFPAECDALELAP
ncbi:STAS domain-containing protein [Streptomyces sp. TRM43335]|uniref:STAS domain-containing protein n=1 Tax=Streptomyces taklimakanensis TaxID=2569853 RepID=A0A6G2B6S4_9ACTN|nr:MEDS domain-containing protein [Streptomyces taklimakanensis]MTE17826.1 STAS domain-containing protein [Streptomyces taklimakanensis]